MHFENVVFPWFCGFRESNLFDTFFSLYFAKFESGNLTFFTMMSTKELIILEMHFDVFFYYTTLYRQLSLERGVRKKVSLTYLEKYRL